MSDGRGICRIKCRRSVIIKSAQRHQNTMAALPNLLPRPCIAT